MSTDPNDAKGDTVSRVFTWMRMIGFDSAEQAQVFGRAISNELELETLQKRLVDSPTKDEAERVGMIFMIFLRLAILNGTDLESVRNWMEDPNNELGFDPKQMILSADNKNIAKVKDLLLTLIHTR